MELMLKLVVELMGKGMLLGEFLLGVLLSLKWLLLCVVLLLFGVFVCKVVELY